MFIVNDLCFDGVLDLIAGEKSGHTTKQDFSTYLYFLQPLKYIPTSADLPPPAYTLVVRSLPLAIGYDALHKNHKLDFDPDYLDPGTVLEAKWRIPK